MVSSPRSCSSELDNLSGWCGARRTNHLDQGGNLVDRNALALGVIITYMSVIVLIPLAAVVFRSFAGGWDGFWVR